ncbi:hypothetical protein JHK82_027516 [Glycine max]|nr:hypothetical protein JHK87_027407 [Glycine soja]KAG5003504.1 hypothetical protein JHK86_027643 [Glycine max]KAG5126681.1 hypothetical protein JHK82_027516 [Glycine max]KAG5151297.1 hypothetical protein JHK84_027769 [Glycine max]
MEKNKESVHGQGSKKPPDEGGSDDTQKQYFKERLIRKTSMPTETKEPLKNGMTHLDYEGGSLGKVYYEENVLFTIASAIGTPIKVDKSTLNMHHG